MHDPQVPPRCAARLAGPRHSPCSHATVSRDAPVLFTDPLAPPASALSSATAAGESRGSFAAARPTSSGRRASLARRLLSRSVAGCATLTLASVALSGCGSLFKEGSQTAAGVGGAALAAKVTHNATVAAGVGLGVLAATNAGVAYVQRMVHSDEQDEIARAAGPLAVGQVANWASTHAIEIEPDERGRVTVSRVISTGQLDCKEIVFSVDPPKKAPGNGDTPTGFYVATICKDGPNWRWASAEPATPRWGALQ